MENPSPQGPSPPSGRCLWPYSPSVACSPPSVWASSQSGWAAYHINTFFLVTLDKILGLETLLGSEHLWPVLMGLTVVPTVLQMGLLPFCPESPRFLYIIRSQEHHAKSGE
ncbi:hypothetical protein XENOCAPTIV_026949 [Xenoophorus captivus]|uniref:Uncharacterized protein n=1 Tax=Xenoophorus captivus TaxID=1517983 RepID=A0ABV0S120_9TELE